MGAVVFYVAAAAAVKHFAAAVVTAAATGALCSLLFLGWDGRITSKR